MAEVTEFQLREAVAIKSYADPKFRELLLTDPRAAIESLVKVSLPDSLSINVVEDTEASVTLVIPPVPTDELGEEDLEMVAGGVHNLATGKIGDPALAAQAAKYQNPGFRFLDQL